MTRSGRQRFARIETLFHEALEAGLARQDPAARAAWLGRRCRQAGWEAESLVPEVLELIDEDGRGQWQDLERIVDAQVREVSAHEAGFEGEKTSEVGSAMSGVDEVDTDAETLAAPADGPRRSRSPGQPETDPETIGPYRILGRLGRGGLATVYLAERQGEFSMPVALKRIRKGMDTDDILERLRLERQILARLVHPNIARIHDGGSDEAGRPYLVMEVIEGERLDTWCARHEVPLERRLEVFDRVLEAVDYAHQNLVLHRDLKPSNILVTAEGEPKLLDFGIAKLLRGSVEGEGGVDGQGGENGSATSAPTVTGYGNRLLTPYYASPEQILGQPLTTASDVYSLGIVLFELVSGVSPHEVADPGRTASPLPLQSPRRSPWAHPTPSGPWSRVADESPFPRVSDAARRAREDGCELSPPADRFAAQHAAELDAVVMKALEPRPSERYGSARELAEDLERLRSDQPVLARQATWWYRARKLVRRHRTAAGVAALVALSILSAIVGTTWQARVAENERRIAEASRLESESVVRFMVDLFAISNPYDTGWLSAAGAGSQVRAPGQAVTAREVLERAASAIDSADAGGLRRRRLLRRAIGESYLGLSLYDDARRQLEAALGSDGEPADRNRAAVLRNLALLDVFEGRFEPAAERLDRARGILASVAEPWDPEWLAVAEVAGKLELSRGDFAASERRLRAALERLAAAPPEPVDGPAPELVDPEIGPRLRTELGRAIFLQGRQEEALDLFRAVHDERVERLGAHHPRVLESANNLAVASSQAGDFARAEEEFRRILQWQTALLGPEHRELVAVLYNLATTLERQGKLDPAQEHLARALELAEQTQPRGVLRIRILLLDGQVEEWRRRPRESIALYRQAVELGRRHFPDGLEESVTALARLAKALVSAAVDQGEETTAGREERIVEAESLLREALALAESVSPEQRASVRLELGHLALAAGRAEEAQREFRAALEVASVDDRFTAALIDRGLALALSASPADGEEARRRARRAADSLRGFVGREHAWVREMESLAGPG